MVFTSPTFLFLFLPLVLAAFAITPTRLRTALLVAASWVFYAWGEKHLVLLLALSTAINWALALVLDRATGQSRRLLLAVSVDRQHRRAGLFQVHELPADAFSRLHYYVAARGGPDANLVRQERPDVVILLTVERYLPSLGVQ